MILDSPEVLRLMSEFGWSPSLDESTGIPRPMDGVQPDSSYDPERLATLELGRDGWWYWVRNRIIEDLLERHAPDGAVWDLGSGSGVVSRYLREVGREVVAVEPSEDGARISARYGIPSFATDLASLRLPTESLSAVGMFDVLEHLEDRPAVLAEIRRVLRPDGRLVLTLPALMALWSDHDVSGGHYLRYSKRVIRRELREAGFSVVRSGYCFFSAVLPLLLIRAIPHRLGFRQPVAEETMLASDGGLLGRILGAIERRIALRVPVGTSLVVVARPSD